MSTNFYICFCFSQLSYSGQDNLLQMTTPRFKIEFFKDNLLIGKTQNSRVFSNLQFIFNPSRGMISLGEFEDGSETNLGEIRVVRRDFNNETLIGCYKFPINNYVQAYKQLNKNVIKMNVQVSDQFSLEFQVLIQKTESAFKKLREQHVLSKKVEDKSDYGSERNSFLAEEHTLKAKRSSFKKIIVGNSIFNVRTRYWSPEKQRNRYCINLNKVEEDTITSKKTFLRKRTISERSEEDCKQKLSVNEDIFGNLDTLSNQAQPFETHQMIEQVIQSNSEIIIPESDNDYWRYKQMSKEEPNSKRFSSKMSDDMIRSRAKGGLMKKLMIAFVILLVVGLSIGVMVKQVRSFKDKKVSTRSIN